jgi:hypothetical protein
LRRVVFVHGLILLWGILVFLFFWPAIRSLVRRIRSRKFKNDGMDTSESDIWSFDNPSSEGAAESTEEWVLT